MYARGLPIALLPLVLARFLAGQVVVNGDFEDSPITSGYFTNSPVPGWTHTGSTGDGIAGRVGYSDDQGSVTVAGHGQQFAMLGGGFNMQATAAMSTVVTGLTPGVAYKLTFLIANEGEAVTQSLTVSFPSGSSTGQSIFTTTQSAGLYWKAWEPQSMEFVATAASATVQFSVSNQQYDMGLDYVQVTPLVTTPQLQVAPASLSFTAPTDADSPPLQTVVVTSISGPPVGFGITTDSASAGSAAPTWLTVRPAAGMTPNELIVVVNQGSMAPGTYPARIHVSVQNSTLAPVDVAVTLTVTPAQTPQLDATPTPLRFSARQQAPGTLQQTLVVRNGGSGPLAFTTSISGQPSWLSSVTPSNGQTQPNMPVFLLVQVNTAGLAVGSYSAVIALSSSSGTLDVPVTVYVAAGGSIIGLNVTGVRFEARQGAGVSTAQSIAVLNTGDPTTTVHWTAALQTGSQWLSIVTPSGTATAANPGTLTLMPNSGAATLPAGGAYALVEVSDSKSLNSPQYVVAVLDNENASSLPRPDPVPKGLFFTTPAGGAAPANQTVTVNTSSATAASFQAGAFTFDGASWLSVTPTSGSASTQTPGSLTVSVNPTGLKAGVYSGEVDIVLGGSLRGVNVSLVIQKTAASSSISALHPEAAGCTPAQLVLTPTGLPNSFNTPAAWPETLIAQLNDDCGSPVSGGSVSASFSNGDPPLTLRGDQTTTSVQYAATWQPVNATQQMVVTIRASQGSLAPAVAQLSGSIQANQAPILARNGTLHNLNPVVGGALAPGLIVEMFGSGLASQTALPGVIPLANAFNGTSVNVGGLTAPLYYLSGVQLDAQIPAELTPGEYPILVVANGAYTVPDTIDINLAEPGVAAFGDGTVIAQHAADFSLVTTASPAMPGEYVVIYLAGMGATNPAVASGQPAPSTQPLAAVTLNPVVTLDGQTTSIFFAGMTPGLVGLYQIDFQIPSNARTGSLQLVVTQNGLAANTTTLPVGQ
jgi:uncharacterized protein (TIGR03437 family)